MRMLVLGAGLQGCACAFDLLQQDAVEQVTLADLRPQRIAGFLKRRRSKRLKLTRLDARRSGALARAVRGHDAVLCALPYYFNLPAARAAVAAGVHFADLGGNTEIVLKQKKLDGAARRAGVSVIPDCGLAPGLINVLAAEGIRRLGGADAVRIYVGGLPQEPEPPLNYQIVYSLEGALDYYTTPSWILRDGRPTRVDALSELESVDFPPPLGTLEAFHTGGGISIMPWSYAGKVRVMEYKTLRYPGHVAIMRPIRELGLLDQKPVTLGDGTTVAPRDVFIAAVSPKLTRPEGRDLVALRVEVTAADGRRVAWQMVDAYDAKRGISSMMRTTGYSLAITGLMQVDGRVAATGVATPDEAVPCGDYIAELAKRGVEIREM